MCHPSDKEVVKAPRSPWRRLFRQPLRPRLSRKVVGGARVNLNRYWSKFEELAQGALVSAITAPLDPHADQNAINENIDNEKRENASFKP